MTLMKRKLAGVKPSTVKTAFDTFDADGSGDLDRQVVIMC
jgi:hypothetical protein